MASITDWVRKLGSSDGLSRKRNDSRMKRFVLLAFALLLVLPLDAQQIFNEVKYKRFNFGAKVGMNASFPVINTLKVNGTKNDDITMQYRVGYLFSVFGRINMHRF